MKRKIISVLLAVAVIVAYSVPCFASSVESDEKHASAEVEEIEELVAEAVEEVTEEETIVSDLVETVDSIECYSEDMEVSVPADASDEICMSFNDEEISMELPESIGNQDAAVTDDGSIVYCEEGAPVEACVQVIEDEDCSDSIGAVRTMVIINDIAAPKEYEFDFNLPAGYKMVHDYDYEADDALEACSGAIYIVDENGESISTIEPAWAVDANGRSLDTHYEICGTTLIQVVDFEGAAFPVIADPTNHPDKYTILTLDKDAVKELRDKAKEVDVLAELIECTASGSVDATGYLVSKSTKEFVKRAGALLGGVGAAWTYIEICDAIYKYVQYKSWNNIYEKMKENSSNKYVKIKYRWKYHGGHKAYYPAGKESIEFCKKK